MHSLKRYYISRIYINTFFAFERFKGMMWVATFESLFCLIIKANVIRFEKLIECLRDRFQDKQMVNVATVIPLLQRSAVLLCGWWVVKRLVCNFLLLNAFINFQSLTWLCLILTFFLVKYSIHPTLLVSMLLFQTHNLSRHVTMWWVLSSVLNWVVKAYLLLSANFFICFAFRWPFFTVEII